MAMVEEKGQPASSPLPLQGADNARDLGGYRTRQGLMTRERRLVRSDGLNGLTERDRQFLLDYGVTCIIDLRGEQEVRRAPDPAIPGVRYCRYPMLDQVQSGGFRGELPPSIAELYITLLARDGELLCGVLREILRSWGTVLFHCTAGKDRTGVVAMLLLKLAEVDSRTVVNDYAVTERYMTGKFARQREILAEQGIDLPDYVGRSNPLDMEKTLDYLHRQYGGVESYLLQMGMNGEELQDLKSRLLD